MAFLTINTCEILVSPKEVDAGAEMSFVAKVVCDPACDLRGRSLQIKDHAGALVEEVPFTQFDGEVNTTSSIKVKAPDDLGTYEWCAVPLAEADGGEIADDVQTVDETTFTFTVSAHATRLLVWDVPSSIEAGQNFTMKIGVKCSSSCDMAGRPFEILNQAGDRVAAGELTGERWPGSEGLYYAELELTAPESENLHEWQVLVPSQEQAYPHQAASAAFRLRTVARPEFTVRIEAVDSEKEEPLSNINIVMHPYRARINGKGVAEVKVAKGTYTIYVSKPGYYPVKRDIEVTEDVTTRAPLTAEPPPSKDW